MSRLRAERRADAGFSMVESLVALAVFALAGVGLVHLQAQSLQTLSRVEEQALADMIAQNQLVDAAARIEPPDLGAREDDVELAGRSWTRRLIVAATPDPLIRRVTVEVRPAAADRVTARAHGFVSAPARAPVMPAAQP